MTDEDGGSSSIKVAVDVKEVNDAPEAEMIKPVEAIEDESSTFVLSDHLNVTDIDTPLDQLIYTFNAANGYVEIKDGKIIYTGRPNFSGVDKITVTINDGQGGVTKVDLTVNVKNVNDAPTATNETISTVVMQSGSVTGSLGVTDVDGDKLLYPTSVRSKNGLTVMIDENGNYSYKPGDGYKYQSDSFEVTVKDPSGLSVTVHVNVKIDPKPLEQSVAKMSLFMADDMIDTNETNDQQLTSKGTLSDDLIFNLLSDYNLGGNTEATVTDFKLGSTQHVDVSALLSASANATNIGEYLSVQYDAVKDQAVISIDRDGAATDYQAADLLILSHQKTDITLDELLKNSQIII